MSASSPSKAHSGSFRDDIEGLRGVAVGSVVLFHAFPALLPGGFIGVDVFFVISGYLITTLLLREGERSGRIDLPGFWARRVRRILPAATLVLVSVAVIILALPWLDARLFGKHVIAAALFYYNWRQANEAVNYFASDDRDNFLLHYWSLAVEEQFYLFWPLLLAAFVYWSRKRQPMPRGLLSVLIAILCLASLAACIIVTRASESLGFFATYSRAWQLLTGALVAIAILDGPVLRRRSAGIAGGLALVALLASFWLISRSLAYPGYVAVVPTIAAAVLIASGASGSPTATALANAPLRYVGRISYSWYLWHWPAIVLSGLVLGPIWLGQWAAIFVSFALASAAYHLVETPLRFNTRLLASNWLTIAFGAALIALAAGTGLAMKHLAQDDVPLGNGQVASRSALEKDRADIYREGCMLRIADTQQRPCVYGAPDGNRTVVLLGDSHAAHWFPPLDAAARNAGWRVVVRVKAACAPSAGTVLRLARPYGECMSWLGRTFDEIPRLHPDLIIVASAGNQKDEGAELGGLERLARTAPVVAIRSTPFLPEPPDVCLRRTRKPEECTWRVDSLSREHQYPKAPASALPKAVSLLDLSDRVCPGGICSAVTGGRVIATDTHHLTKSFALTMTDEFERLLRAQGSTSSR